MAKATEFIQIGILALRDAKTGDYLPAIPLYIRAEDSTIMDEKLIDDFSRLLANQLRRRAAMK